jgi:hypothetical protein
MNLTFAPHLHGVENYSFKLFSSRELSLLESGGEAEIRTQGTLAGSTVFETAAFDHSATSPHFNCFRFTRLGTVSLVALHVVGLHCHYFYTEARHGLLFCVPTGMGITQGGFDFGMPEQFLHRHDIGSLRD